MARIGHYTQCMPSVRAIARGPKKTVPPPRAGHFRQSTNRPAPPRPSTGVPALSCRAGKLPEQARVRSLPDRTVSMYGLIRPLTRHWRFGRRVGSMTVCGLRTGSSACIDREFRAKPRVVPTALDSRSPDVMVGFSVSKGIAFLLQVRPAASNLSLACLPVQFPLDNGGEFGIGFSKGGSEERATAIHCRESPAGASWLQQDPALESVLVVPPDTALKFCQRHPAAFLLEFDKRATVFRPVVVERFTAPVFTKYVA
jgi:hypothetical protein